MRAAMPARRSPYASSSMTIGAANAASTPTMPMKRPTNGSSFGMANSRRRRAGPGSIAARPPARQTPGERGGPPKPELPAWRVRVR